MTEHIPFGTQPDPRPKPTELNFVFKAADVGPDLIFVEVHNQDQQSIRVGTWAADGEYEQLTITPADFEHSTVTMGGEFHPPEPDEMVAAVEAVLAASIPENVIADAVWSPPPVRDRPDGYQCLLFHRDRWRHMAWIQTHKMWMFGYGSAFVMDAPDRRYAPLPDGLQLPMDQFWKGDPS